MQAHVELYRETVRKKWIANADELFIDSEHPGMMRVNGEWLEEDATYEAKGKWRWRFKKGRNIMADSGQGYSRRTDCLRSCAVVLGGEVDSDDHGNILRFVVNRNAAGYMMGHIPERIEVRDLTREDG